MERAKTPSGHRNKLLTGHSDIGSPSLPMAASFWIGTRTITP
jgi:hypothetical protein